jgi:hypothetical protein
VGGAAAGAGGRASNSGRLRLHLSTPPRKRAPVRTTAVDLGRCLIGNIDNVADVLAVAEGESFR